MSIRPALLTPFDAPQNVYPFRRIWRTALIEVALLIAVAAGLILVARFTHITFNDTLRRFIGLGLALLPLLLWIVISYRGERRAARPRARLPLVLFLTALLANAVGVPLVDQVFAVDSWLPAAGAISRILGYAMIVGFTTEFLKFAVLRYTIWESNITTRQDAIAYSLAAAVGYATVLNLNFALSQISDPAAVAARVAGTTLSQMAISLLVGLALSELRLGSPAVVGLPLSIGIAALLHGIYVVARNSLVVSAFSEKASGSAPAGGIIIGTVLVVLLFGLVSFLIRTADVRAKRTPAFQRN
jgi:membrane protein YdbS with pleckstrin-like domain